ncbi:hypothetical protein C3L33_11186, partial [Rhododendron williamsianum]
MNYNLKPSSFPTHHHWYSATLNSLTTTSSDSDSDSDSLLLYTYTTAYHGFAVSLTPSQAESLRRSDSVLGMYQDTLYSLHTTRTPEFLGLDPRLGLWARPHPTSTQPGLPGSRRGCSRQREPPKFLGLDPQLGLWAGHTPLQLNQASQEVVVAALDTRVQELRRLPHPVPSRIPPPLPLRPGVYQDTLYSLHTTSIPEFLGLDTQLGLWAGHTPLQLNQASQSQEVVVGVLDTGVWPESKSIFVSCLAGNSGPGKGSLVNVAPWIMTVGARTIDRDFPAYAVMGDGKRFTGVSLYSGKGMGKKPVGLVYITGKNSSSNLCLRGSLEPDVVRGKLVFCDGGINARVEKGLVVRDAGGVGMILANTAASGEELVADSHLLLAVAVGRKVGDLIRDYVRKDGATAQVLKPDVIEPGVIILAGWSEAVGPTGLDQYTRKIQFKFKSGVWIEGATGRQWDLICRLGLRRRPRTALKHQVVAVLPADARPLAIANLNATARGPQRGPGRASK